MPGRIGTCGSACAGRSPSRTRRRTTTAITSTATTTLTTLTGTRMGSSTGRSSVRARVSRPLRSASPSSARPLSRSSRSFATTSSVALLADLVHNFGDAMDGRSARDRILPSQLPRREDRRPRRRLRDLRLGLRGSLRDHPAVHPPGGADASWVLAAAGTIGFVGNELAARVRLHAGRRLSSPALVADGNHARTDAFVSLGVIASAVLVGLGLPIGDPIIGLVITLVIFKITWDSWRVVSTTDPGEMVDHTHYHDLRLDGRRAAGAPLSTTCFAFSPCRSRSSPSTAYKSSVKPLPAPLERNSRRALLAAGLPGAALRAAAAHRDALGIRRTRAHRAARREPRLRARSSRPCSESSTS